MNKKALLVLICLLAVLMGALVACSPDPVTIDKIELTSSPKTLYELGDSLDFLGANIKVTYSNGATAIVDLLETASVSGFRQNTVGEQLITVKYTEALSDAFTSFSVAVIRPKAASVTTTPASKLEYIVGQTPDFSGASATVIYDKTADGVALSEVFNLDSSLLSSNVDMSTAGTKTMVFSLYTDPLGDTVTASYDITVSDREISSIGLASSVASPDKTKYAIGSELDLSGLSLRLYMNDGTTQVVDEVVAKQGGGWTLATYGGIVTTLDSEGNAFDSSVEKSTELFVYYKTSETADSIKVPAPFTVEALVKNPVSGSGEYSKSIPVQIQNKDLFFDGANLTVTFNDQTKITYVLDDYTKPHSECGFSVSGFDKTMAASPQNLNIVFYKENIDGTFSDDTYNIYYTLVLSVRPEAVESISVTDPAASVQPQYTSWLTSANGVYSFAGYVGDTLPLNSYSFVLNYNSGKTETVSASSLTATVGAGTYLSETSSRVYRLNKAGTTTLTVGYNTNAVTAVLNVTIKELSFHRLALTPPSVTEYKNGDVFNVSGAELVVEYSEKDVSPVATVRVKRISGAELSSLIDMTAFDTTEAGVKTLTITYSDEYTTGATIDFDVTVTTGVSALSVATAPTKIVYINGETLDTAGLSVIQHFGEGAAADTVTISDFSDGAWQFSVSTLNVNAGSLSSSVTVMLTYLGVVSTTFDVTVTNYITAVNTAFVGAVSTAAFIVTEGTEIVYSDYEVRLTHQDGTVSATALTKAMLNYDKTTNYALGDLSLTLSYTDARNNVATLTTTTYFTVIAKVFAYYELEGDLTHKHVKGDSEFVGDGLNMLKWYNNGTSEYVAVYYGGYALPISDDEYPKASNVTVHLSVADAAAKINPLTFRYKDERDVSAVSFTIYLNYAVSSSFVTNAGDATSAPSITMKEGTSLVSASGAIWAAGDIVGSGAVYDAWRAALNTLNSAYVKISYSDGSVTNPALSVADGGFTIEGYDPAKLSVQTPYLVKTDNPTVRLAFVVYMDAKEIVSVNWKAGSTFNPVIEGMELTQANLTSAYLEVGYDFGNNDFVPVTVDMISGYDYTVDGVGMINDTTDIPIDVSYGGTVLSDKVLVVTKKVLLKIEFKNSPKSKYFEGESFNMGYADTLRDESGNTVMLALIYNNNTQNNLPIALSAVDYSAFDSSEMTGAAKQQTVTVSYLSKTTYYVIAVNDRKNVTVAYDEANSYVYTYGNAPSIAYAVKNGTETVSSALSHIEYVNSTHSYRLAGGVFVQTATADGATADFAHLPAGDYRIKIVFDGRPHTAALEGLNPYTEQPHTVRVLKKDLQISLNSANPEAPGILESKVYSNALTYGYSYFTNTVGLKEASFVDGESYADLIGSLVISLNGVALGGSTVVSGAGTYAIVLSGYSSANYNLIYATSSFVIAPQELFIKMQDQTVAYGTSELSFTQSSGLFAIVNAAGDAVNIAPDTLSGQLLRNQTGEGTAHGNAVGVYPISMGDLVNPNYTLAFHSSTPSPKYIVVETNLYVSVDNQSVTYGDTSPTFSVTITGFKWSDTIQNSLTGSPVYTFDGSSTVPVDVKISGGIVSDYTVAVSGFSAENYTVVYAEGSYTINRKTVTVTAEPEQNKYFGDPDPAGVSKFAYSVAGLVGDDTLLGSLGRVAGEDVVAGGYAYTLGTLDSTNNPNYNPVLATGGFYTINPKPVILVLGGLSKQYDGTAPQGGSVTYTFYDGAVEVGQEYTAIANPAASAVLTFDNSASGIGNYPVAMVDADQNHEITLYSDYNYQIVPRELAVVFQTKLSNESVWVPFTSDVSFYYNYTYFRHVRAVYAPAVGEGAETVNAAISADNPQIILAGTQFTYDIESLTFKIKNAGRWSVLAQGVEDNNYVVSTTLSPQSQNLVIDKLPLTVYATPNHLTSTYVAGSTLAVSSYSVYTAASGTRTEITGAELTHIKNSVLSLKVGGGGQQNVQLGGYVVNIGLEAFANYTAVADAMVPQYSVSDYLADVGGYDAETLNDSGTFGVLRYVVNKKKAAVTIASANLSKNYDAAAGIVAGKNLTVSPSNIADSVSRSLVFTRLSAPDGSTSNLNYVESDTGTFSVKIDNSKMTDTNFFAYFDRTAASTLTKVGDQLALYNAEDYYTYTINKQNATIVFTTMRRSYNSQPLISSDVKFTVSNYYPAGQTAAAVQSATSLAFSFQPTGTTTDPTLTGVGTYLTSIASYSDNNHIFTMFGGTEERTFRIDRLTLYISIWDMYRRYDGVDATSDTKRLVGGVETAVADYRYGFDIDGYLLNADRMSSRAVTLSDLNDCYIVRDGGADSGLYDYTTYFPIASNPNFAFSVEQSTYEVKRAQIKLGISDNAVATAYGSEHTENYAYAQIGSAITINGTMTYSYTDWSGVAVELNSNTPAGVYRIYAVTADLERNTPNYEFLVEDTYYDNGNSATGGYGKLTIDRAQVNVTLSRFDWEYRNAWSGVSEDPDFDYAKANLKDMFSFACATATEIDFTMLEGFRYPVFNAEFYATGESAYLYRLSHVLGVAATSKYTLSQASFAAESLTSAVNDNFYFTIANSAEVVVSAAPLSVDVVSVQLDGGGAIDAVETTIRKTYGDLPTAAELGIKYSGFKDAAFDGALYFNGNWYVINGNDYALATAIQVSQIVAESGGLMSRQADLPAFYDIKAVDIYDYKTEMVGSDVMQVWQKVGWEPRVELLYGFRSSGNPIAADASFFSSQNYTAVTRENFIFYVLKKPIDAKLSADNAVLKRTYDTYLKVGVDYFITYTTLVSGIPAVVNNAASAYYAGRPTTGLPTSDGTYKYSGGTFANVTPASGYVSYDTDSYYYTVDGSNRYTYYVDADGEIVSLSATATIEERPVDLFYKQYPTREWFDLTDQTSRVNSSNSGETPVNINLAGLYNENYTISFSSNLLNGYSLAIYNRIDYLIVGDSTIYATLLSTTDTYIPIKVYYVDGTSSELIKYYPNYAANDVKNANTNITLGGGGYDYVSSVTGNQTVKVNYKELNPLIGTDGGDGNKYDVASAYIVVRKYPQSTTTVVGSNGSFNGGESYIFGSPMTVGGTKIDFTDIIDSSTLDRAFDRVDVEFALDATAGVDGVFDVTVWKVGNNSLSIRIKSGAGQQYKLYIVENENGVETETEYYTYNISQSVFVDLFDGRAHLYTAYVNRLTHTMTLIIDNSLNISHDLRYVTAAGYDLTTRIANIRFPLETFVGNVSSLCNTDVSFSVTGLTFNVLAFSASRIGYESEMGVSIMPNTSASDVIYVSDEEPTAIVYTKTNFFVINGSYTDGTSIRYFINGIRVADDSLSDELSAGTYRLTARVAKTANPTDVVAEAYFDLTVAKRSYQDGFQDDVGTPTAASPVTLKTQGFIYHDLGASSNINTTLRSNDTFREYGVQLGVYYVMLAIVNDTKYIAMWRATGTWSTAYGSYVQYDLNTDGLDVKSFSGQFGLGANGISALEFGDIGATVKINLSAGGSVTGTMNSVGTYYSGHTLDYSYYRTAFTIAKTGVTSGTQTIAINLKTNEPTNTPSTSDSYQGLALMLSVTAGAVQTSLVLKMNGNTYTAFPQDVNGQNTTIDWLTTTSQKFTVEAYFDKGNSFVTAIVYLGDEVKNVMTISRTSVLYSQNGGSIENEIVIPEWPVRNADLSEFVAMSGSQSYILSGANIVALDVYGVNIGGADPIKHALYTLSAAGGSGDVAVAAPRSYSSDKGVVVSTNAATAVMLSSSVDRGYATSYNSYAARFSLGFVDDNAISLRFMLAENLATDIQKQYNGYANTSNFTSTRAIALVYEDDRTTRTASMYFTFMTGLTGAKVFKQTVFSIDYSLSNDWRVLSDGETHTIAVNIYKAPRELNSATLLSQNQQGVQAGYIEIYIDGVLYTVDGSGEYSSSSTSAARFYYPYYNSTKNWLDINGTSSDGWSIDLADKYFLNERTMAGIVIANGELCMYDLIVAETDVDTKGEEPYFVNYKGMGGFFS